MIHADQGSQYTGSHFQEVLRKRELINDENFTSISQAQMEIFKYIETYYNTKRIHSALGYQSPKKFENSHS
ncbi:hypothetical protein D7143_13670 [Enterococcus faecalis]|nr:hypothetical protein [Enterococcus faecalis]